MALFLVIDFYFFFPPKLFKSREVSLEGLINHYTTVDRDNVTTTHRQ